MTQHKLEDELNTAIDTLMTEHNSPELSPEIAAMLRIAEQLMELPHPEFRRRLQSALLASTYGRALVGVDGEQIELALAEMAERSPFLAYDLAAAAADLPDGSMRFLAQMDRCTIGVSRGSKRSNWERHPAADELLYVLDGAMDVTTATASGPVVSTVGKGAAFICPRGLWHRVDPHCSTTMLFATPGEGTAHAATDEPPPLEDPSSLTVQAPVQIATATGRGMLDIGASTSHAEAEAAFRELLAFNDAIVTVGRFRGLTPWERHQHGDELLHVLEGEVELTVLTTDGPIERRIAAGSIFVCPRGLWHRQYARQPVTGLFATPRPTEVSWAEDPTLVP